MGKYTKLLKVLINQGFVDKIIKNELKSGAG